VEAELINKLILQSGAMYKPTIKRCHGCCGEGTHISKEGCEILQHTIELIFKSHEW
jgi:hypothetical protein